jgi:hypothetical protein
MKQPGAPLPGFFMRRCVYKGSWPNDKSCWEKLMSADDKKSKTTPAKKEPVTEGKTADVAPKAEGAKTEASKTDGAKPEAAKAEAAKPDAAPTNKGMGEGQKPVSQAYKDNWNAIFGKKTATKTVKKAVKKKKR